MTIEDKIARDAEITIECLFTDAPVRGNAFDQATEDEILARLVRGDQWAWCTVKVTGTYKGLTASDYLGCCSYDNEQNFIAGGYYDDMVARVRQDLLTQVQEIKRA